MCRYRSPISCNPILFTPLWLALAASALAGCSRSTAGPPGAIPGPAIDAAPDRGPPAGPEIRFVDVTDTHLPGGSGLHMDAAAVDIDGDGDLDLAIAQEFRRNLLLVNDGTGRFSSESAQRLPHAEHDSEDVGVADFDLDGDPDIVVVSEDDRIHELYGNDGTGRFTDEGLRIPVQCRTGWRWATSTATATSTCCWPTTARTSP
jgi:hypothetical protein